MPEPPYTNQRPFPLVGAGISVNQFRSDMAPWIDKATSLIEGTQVVTAAQNALNDPHEQLQALIWARAQGDWSPPAQQKITAEINALSTFIHNTEGGPIRF